MKGLMKELFLPWFKLQNWLLYWNSIKKTVWIAKAKILFYKQSKWKASWRNSLCLDLTFKTSCYIEIPLEKKNSLNCQGQNSFHKQSKWKASWRNSLCLDSPFKTSCCIETLFTDWSFLKGIIIFVAFLQLTIGDC